jgi:Concanavalin A-like lectin/glucanases superfamily
MKRKFTFLAVWVTLAFSIPAFSQNSAILFNGADNLVTTLHDVIPTNTDFTVEFWALVPALTLDGIPHQFMSQGDAGSGAGFYIGYDGTTGILQAGDAWPNVNGIVMPTAQWVHMAMVFDQNFDTVGFYLNGVEVGSNSSYQVAPGSSHLKLGVQTDNTGFITGKMDEVRVWNTIRTAQQIKADMYGVLTTTPDLVAQYKMDEGSSNLVSSSATTTGLDGTLQGTINASTWAFSPVQFGNNGLTFDGLNDNKVTLPNASGIYDLTAGTVECWINPTSLTGTTTVMASRGPGGVRYSLDLTSTTVGLTNGAITNTVNASVPIHSWSHIAFASDGTNTTIYVNGAFAGTVAGSLGGAVTKQPVSIGVAQDLSGPDIQQFAGSIDEVRIWNIQRSQGQINTAMNNSLTGAEPNLIGLFSFNQGVDGADNTGLITAVDNTVNNNHGTLANFTLTGINSNFVLDNGLSGTPLPITLTKFTAVRQGSEALLQWQTGVEENTRNFVIERSPDGSLYTAIGTVAAAGNSTRTLNYSFTDLTPEKNADYYRLKQTDLDNHFTYSPVKVILFPSAGRLVWYATGNKTVQVNLQQGNNERYSLTDLDGHVLREGQLSGGKTDISGYPAGLYIIQVMTGTGQTINAKILLP